MDRGLDPRRTDAVAAIDFGALLTQYRRVAGWTQEELADAAQVSIRAISNIERGRTRGPQQRSTEALADALGLVGADRDRFLDSARHGRRRGTDPVSRQASAVCAFPRKTTDFLGRSAELDLLRATAESRTDSIAVISGLAGVGKTSLVVAAADLLRKEFPAGQFFLDLRGMDEQPLSPTAALERLLRAVGVAEAALPPSFDERAGLWRTVTRERRVLLVLDNAADEAQVRPLLPTGGGCLTLITARRTLAGLDAAHRLPLDVLEGDDAVSLLSEIIGARRATAESAAVAHIAALCGNLPLALRIAGNRMATRPQWAIRELATQLSDRRLSTLTAGDVHLRPLFAQSYRQLHPTTRRVFRFLALIPRPDFAAPLAAATVDLDLATTRDALTELADASLLQRAATTGRYRLHGLLRSFAAELLSEEEIPAARDSATDRMLDWLRHASDSTSSRDDTSVLLSSLGRTLTPAADGRPGLDAAEPRAPS
ncbi:helix-turn-helix domain-containing protein [Saccharopolyspora sp. 5N708]|uniref:helix-turn-helix domain-containing protein n=1 Tax=Saccharopolyspora sp. 5N708 TaxID=3457424 RepID=UPI003FD4125C